MVAHVSKNESITEFTELSSVINECLEQADGPLLVAVDGRSGTGKTSLANNLTNIFDMQGVGSVLLHGDDFCDGGTFEKWSAHTPHERYELSKNWERLRDDALIPLLAGRTALWHAYDWGADKLSPQATISEPKSLIILEGVFSVRPELADLVDLSVLVNIPHSERVRRIALREGDNYMQSWFPIWEETEDLYFGSIAQHSSFDTIYDNTHPLKMLGDEIR